MREARNVLLITADGGRTVYRRAGHPCIETPHLDALARDSASFGRHYCQALPCGPSRASLHTGQSRGAKVDGDGRQYRTVARLVRCGRRVPRFAVGGAGRGGLQRLDIGSDTLTGVNDTDYTPLFTLTAKLALTVDRPRLSPEDIKKLQRAATGKAQAD